MVDDYFPDDDDRLNVNALRALWGYSANYVRDLCALLQSQQPIHPRVREALAEALLGAGLSGVRLTMSGHGQKMAADYEARFKWMEIGSFVQAHIEANCQRGARTKALEAAVEKFPASYATCDKAHLYFRRVGSWIESVRVPGTFYGQYSEHELAIRFHGYDANGEAPPSNDEIARTDARIAEIAESLIGPNTE